MTDPRYSPAAMTADYPETVIVPARVFFALEEAARRTTRILFSSEHWTTLGLQNFLMWPDVEGNDYIVVIRGES